MARLRKIAEDILRRYPDRFTDDFEHNKRVLQDLVDVESKYLRNALAGYITRYMSRASGAEEEEKEDKAEAAAA